MFWDNLLMFGVLKPALCRVSEKCKESYRLSYCNLCAALSASGAGVLNRFFLINDVVTIDWLLRAEKNSAEYSFKCHNCAKGGAIGRKKSVSEHQKFLAAVSSYVCGVKIRDNAADNPGLINKSIAIVYKPIMQKAEATLAKLNLLDKLQEYEQTDRENELNLVNNLAKASLPTEKCYELCTIEDGKYLTYLPRDLLSLLGRYLGRCVYFLDAIADMDKDKKANQYNVLNLQIADASNQYHKAQIIGLCLDYLKPMRHDLSAMLDSLAPSFNVSILKSRWDSLFSSIEHQILKLVEPLNSQALFNKLATFGSIANCTNCSSWSPMRIGCCCCCCPCC